MNALQLPFWEIEVFGEEDPGFDTERDAGMRSRYVLVDLSKVRSIGGCKPWWR